MKLSYENALSLRNTLSVNEESSAVAAKILGVFFFLI